MIIRSERNHRCKFSNEPPLHCHCARSANSDIPAIFIPEISGALNEPCVRFGIWVEVLFRRGLMVGRTIAERSKISDRQDSPMKNIKKFPFVRR